MTSWGIVATVKAASEDILNFAAHHIELGADEVNIYLDEPNQAAEALDAHPKVKLTLCDAKYWKMRRPKEEHQRPPMHQGRQFANAKWAYMHTKVDWLIHIDIDEFLWPETPVAQQLAALPDSALCARIRPWEALADPDGERPEHRPPAYYKGCAPAQAIRQKQTERIYPGWGIAMNGGFQ